ncbi:hypothetical protein MLD38_035972 [Melastoma candidum]|uniref:Uncharacterized protein n=1 Tax=Melastoma candidum TaxID=119954 RepID=A0ACB9LHQ8_9MYRT|nr:hypothetical protein MLD38_035972 [Melastoma candidum]
MWESESESFSGRDYGNYRALTSNRQGVKTDGFELRDQSWEEISLAYLLLSRSGKFNPMIYEARDLELCKVVLDDLPGGPESFELAAKFCYGIAVDLTAANISGLRCMAKMAEDLEEGNLIFKTWAENTGKTPKVSSPKWNGDVKESSPSRNVQVPPDWWFEDVSILRIDHFVRVITAIKVKGMRYELIGAAIAWSQFT